MRSTSIKSLLLCTFFFACPQLISADNSPNILFILADDMGWTDAGFAGSDLYETPHLDALARQCMKFTNSYSACHVCSPTRASIMTGKYPARLALTDFIPGGKDRGMNSPAWTKYLPLHEVTIAEALKPAGYVCGHFGKWHLNKDKRYVEGRAMDPASQGFDDVLSTVKPSSKHDPADDAHHAYEITRRAEEFMEANRDRPFFCYVPHHVLHTPLLGHPDVVPKFEAKAVTAKNHKNAIYAAMAHDLDQSVGRLLQKLVDLDLVEQTLVIFTSDNGGLVSGSRRPPTSNFPLRDGKGTNYEGGIRVPTLVRWPGVISPATCDHPIISNDFYPTLLEIAKTRGDQRHNTKVDGMSIVPLLKDPEAKLGRDALYWHYPHYHSAGATPHGAIRVGKWKLIEFYDDRHVELYDLESDIGEAKDLAPTHPEKADALRAQLAAWRQQIGAQMPTAE